MKKDIFRKDRKKQHIEEYLKTTYKNNTLLEDVYIEHNSLPELNLGEIDTKVKFLGKVVDYPIMINAITGGTEFSQEINRDLSKLAKKYNIPIAVGSQTIALKDENSHNSFTVVREIVGDEGVVIANLNAHANLSQVKYAIDLIEADGIQLHLNPAQELVMKEGDRGFRGILSNIEEIVYNIKEPVIVKEVGFGISKDVAERLYDARVKYIDISGTGGTNFIEIEDRRNDSIDFSDIYSWGIPTALSLIQCRNVAKDICIISSGGIKTSLDILKSLILGADIIGISGELLKHLVNGGFLQADKYIGDLLYKLRVLMLLTGSRTINELEKVPYKITGQLKDLLE